MGSGIQRLRETMSEKEPPNLITGTFVLKGTIHLKRKRKQPAGVYEAEREAGHTWETWWTAVTETLLSGW